MALASKLSRVFSKAEVNKMDKAAKKSAGSPGYDDDTIAAQKEYLKETRENKRTSGDKKTSKEEKAADRDAYDFAMGKDRAEKKSKSAKELTPAEKKAAQDSLKFNRGGVVKKKMMASGGMVAANCGASVKPTQKAKT